MDEWVGRGGGERRTDRQRQKERDTQKKTDRQRENRQTE